MSTSSARAALAAIGADGPTILRDMKRAREQFRIIQARSHSEVTFELEPGLKVTMLQMDVWIADLEELVRLDRDGEGGGLG